jgi:hypothetical protein
MLIGHAGSKPNRTERCVDQHRGIEGCIRSVHGIFHEVTKKIEEATPDNCAGRTGT